jgi:citrate lyase subunit beta/citryl-CoA lyase
MVMAPAVGEAFEAALASAADAVALSLADASQPGEALREQAVAALQRVAGAGKSALVAVNHPRTQLLRADLEAVVTPYLGGVLLPHARVPQDMRDLAVLLREFEYTRGIEPGAVAAFPVIDSAGGLLRALEIVHAAPRAGGLVFAAAAYASDVSARHEERGERLAYARGAVVAAAWAADLRPLAVSSPLELPYLARCGFAGALLPGPEGVDAANAAFTPAPEQRERAERHVRLYEAARAESAWVARDGDEMVDMHAVRKARQVLEQFDA